MYFVIADGRFTFPSVIFQCRLHRIIYCHMACLFFSSALIDQTLSLPSSSTRQKYIDNDQLDNLFLLTSCQSYCCCYLFVFPCIISSSFFFSLLLLSYFLVHLKSSMSTRFLFLFVVFISRI
jgi:hypothetical protein